MVFWRVTVTALVGWVGYQAALLVGCTSVGFAPPLELVCYPTDAGLVSGPMATACLAVAGGAVLALTWTRPYRRRRTASVTTTALTANLHRLNRFATSLDHADPSPNNGERPAASASGTAESSRSTVPRHDTDPLPEEPGQERYSDQLVEELTRQVFFLSEKITSGSVKPQDVFWQWFALLKDLNTQHAGERLPTETFTRLNTRLLDLIPQPRRPTPTRTRREASQAADEESIDAHPSAPRRHSPSPAAPADAERVGVPTSSR